MRREFTRTRGTRFCTIEVELADDESRLSICGTEGRIISRGAGKKEALDYWTGYFEENPAEIYAMGQRFGKQFRTARGAARFVLETDGEFHGLDVTGPSEGSKLRIVESCGQIRETILEFFPEVASYLAYHLNDMHAGCEHQDALGWGNGKTIALASGDLTPAQRETIEADALRACEKKREVEYKARWADLRASKSKAAAWVKAHGETPTVDLVNHLMASSMPYGVLHHRDVQTFNRWLLEDLWSEIKPEPFEAAIYKDSLCAPCPVCGYKYGTQWLKRALPPEVIAWAKGLPGTLSPVAKTG